MTKRAYACRCFSAATGEPFAVKRLSPYQETHFPYLLDNEIRGLAFANGFSTPRVVKFVESLHRLGGEFFLILEYGLTLMFSAATLLSCLKAGTMMLKHTCKHVHVLCRLVEGTSLSECVSNGLMPGSPAFQEHEDKVFEIAAQLVQVCPQQFAGMFCL